MMPSIDNIPAPRTPVAALDIDRIRQDFPILHQEVNGYPLTYLDNAATTQKPNHVLTALDHYYRQDNANVHRGVHALSERATQAYEQGREKVRNFLNARNSCEIVFVRGTTEAINLVANGLGLGSIASGDEIIISAMEHHSNIVPWQMLCERTGAVLRVIPMNDAGELDLAAYRQLLGPKTRLVSVVHVSNALGTINPAREIVALAKQAGALTLLDGAQAVAHIPVDVQSLDCDFYAFSSHKLFGPTGLGVLYGREAVLGELPPYQGGGDMIRTVSFEKTEYQGLPYRFEAGTPHIAGAIGLGAAIDYISQFDFADISAYEQQLLEYATAAMADIPGIRLIGTAQHKAAVISFLLEGVHPHDIGTILDQQGIAIRAGHHCAMPVMTRYGIPATVRASFSIYNTPAEIDQLVSGIDAVRRLFS